MHLVKALIATVLLLGATVGARAQFHGKTITIVVGFSPGGGYDAYARVLARHLGNHLAGNPKLVVQNMPGASSLKAIEFLDNGAASDGTVTTAFNPGLIAESLISPERLKFKFTNVAWLGSITRDERICYAWHGTGIKSMADLKGAKQFHLGSPAPGTSSYISAEILKSIFNIEVIKVTGYPGSAEQRLAIERGELDGDCGSWSSIPAEWIAQKKISPLLRFSSAPIRGLAADLPYVVDHADGEDTKNILRMLIAGDEVGRPYVVSKRVPEDRLVALRAAFDATMRDQTFIEEMARLNLPLVAAMDGSAAEQLISSIYAINPRVLAKAKEMFAQ